MLNAPLANTTGLQLAWTAARPRLQASAETRVEALAAGSQCVERDLRDRVLHLRRQGALTRDVPSAPALERPSDGGPVGILLRARLDTRFDARGEHAAAYDLALGGWRNVGPFTLTGSFRDVETPISRARVVLTPVSIIPCDTGCTVPRSSPTVASTVDSSAKFSNARAREFVMSASTWWRGIDVDLSAGTGHSTTDGPRRWVVGLAALPIGGRLDVVMLARASSRQVSPSAHEIGAMVRYHLGRVSLHAGTPAATEPTAFRAEPTARDDVYRLVIHAHRARAVEIRADFTEWRAVSLARVGESEWAVTLPVATGLHQVLMRVDGGEWGVPQGLPIALDGFGERVGILHTGH